NKREVYPANAPDQILTVALLTTVRVWQGKNKAAQHKKNDYRKLPSNQHVKRRPFKPPFNIWHCRHHIANMTKYHNQGCYASKRVESRKSHLAPINVL